MVINNTKTDEEYRVKLDEGKSTIKTGKRFIENEEGVEEHSEDLIKGWVMGAINEIKNEI